MILLLSIFLACGDSDDDGDGGADDSGGQADGGAAPQCVDITAGDDWAWTGECPQMYTPCDIVVKECSFTIDYEADGGMTMGMPFGGVIDGDVVTFNDDSGLSGCVGTVIDADTIEGSCGIGCTFTLSR